MKEVELTQGLVALVSDEDYEKVNALSWYSHKSKENEIYARHDFYFGTKNGIKNRKRVFLHRFILGIEDPKIQVDHINGNRLDNTRENLRICTNQENSRNKTIMRSDNTSGYRGVSYKKDPRYKNKWSARVTLPSGKQKHLGMFATAEEAAIAFDVAAKEMYGKFCGKLNFD